MKALGPLLIGRRAIRQSVQQAFRLVAVALLAALIALSTLANGSIAEGAALTLDWPLLAGVTAAGIAIWRRVPLVGVIALAAAVAALVRLAGG